MMGLRQFLRDLALVPEIWRYAVRGARGRIKMTHKLAVSDVLRLAERELGEHQGAQSGPAWDAKVATHAEAKRAYEIAWAAEIRMAALARQFRKSYSQATRAD